MSLAIPRSNPREKRKGRMLALRYKVLVKSVGFRFIWDVITGDKFASIIDYGILVGYSLELIVALRTCLPVIETRLQEERSIISGDNMQYSVCFLVNTFTGELLGTSKRFQACRPRIKLYW